MIKGDRELKDAERVEADPSVREVSYEMDADKALNDAAESLLMLAGEGLIAGPERRDESRHGRRVPRSERVAVLNCNFLKPRNESLKIHRPEHGSVLSSGSATKTPGSRGALEIRELKILPRRSSETLSTSRR